MKPVVYYSRVENLCVGAGALVWPLDHPSDLVSNMGPAITALVVSINVNGFETQNTVYKEKAHALS